MKELYLIKNPLTFLGVSGDPEKTRISIVGIPFDSTNSFRPGTRFAPAKIRLVSQSLETYSLRAGLSIDDNPPLDEGDVFVVHGSTEASLRNIGIVAEDLISSRRIPVFIGGDHIVTYGILEGIIRGSGKRPCALIFDAHLDFRREYLGYRWSHACTSRRIFELLGSERVMIVGVRAIDREEIKDAKNLGLKYLTILDIERMTLRTALSKIREFTSKCETLYISIDMDVFDPSYAPGVSTPEPEGVDTSWMLNILRGIIDERTIGLDITEVNPLIDYGDVTSFLAARILIEASAYLMSQG